MDLTDFLNLLSVEYCILYKAALFTLPITTKTVFFFMFFSFILLTFATFAEFGIDSFSDGFMLGAALSDTVAFALGTIVGSAPGFVVELVFGAAVGFILGSMVGLALGGIVGRALGTGVGLVTGVTVGFALGSVIGVGVGTTTGSDNILITVSPYCFLSKTDVAVIINSLSVSSLDTVNSPFVVIDDFVLL